MGDWSDAAIIESTSRICGAIMAAGTIAMDRGERNGWRGTNGFRTPPSDFSPTAKRCRSTDERRAQMFLKLTPWEWRVAMGRRVGRAWRPPVRFEIARALGRVDSTRGAAPRWDGGRTVDRSPFRPTSPPNKLVATRQQRLHSVDG